MSKHSNRYARRRRGGKRPFRFYIASLGCPKNTVDSSGMAVLLQRAGYEASLDPKQADVVIVNTCGFIESGTSGIPPDDAEFGGTTQSPTNDWSQLAAGHSESPKRS